MSGDTEMIITTHNVKNTTFRPFFTYPTTYDHPSINTTVSDVTSTAHDFLTKVDDVITTATVTEASGFTEFNISEDYNATLPSVEEISYPPVEFTVAEGVVAIAVLIVGVLGNLLILSVFLCRPWGRPPLVLDTIIGLIATAGLVTTLVSTPLQLFAFYTGK